MKHKNLETININFEIVAVKNDETNLKNGERLSEVKSKITQSR